MFATEEQDSSGTEEQPFYTIEQVSTRLDVTKRTLRYYEEVGLLPPTGRTEGNYRRYSENDIRLLERIKELRDLLGFSLTEIRKLLDAEEERGQLKEAFRQDTDAASKIAHLEQADELIRVQLQLVEQKIAGLEKMRAGLQERLERHKRKSDALLEQ